MYCLDMLLNVLFFKHVKFFVISVVLDVLNQFSIFYFV